MPPSLHNITACLTVVYLISYWEVHFLVLFFKPYCWWDQNVIDTVAFLLMARCVCIHIMLEMRLSNGYLKVNTLLVILMLDLAAPYLLLLYTVPKLQVMFTDCETNKST